MLFRKLFQVAIVSFVFPVFAGDEPLVPNEIVQGFLKEYSDAEKALVQKDYTNIRDFCFHGIYKNKLTYVATAGGPGASKTTILETYLKDIRILCMWIQINGHSSI